MNELFLMSRRLRAAVLACVAVTATLISGCVTITSPTTGSTVSNPVSVGIQLKSGYCNNFKVTLDNADVTQYFSSPYNSSITGLLNVSGGQHTLTASANTQQYWLLIPLCLNGYDGTDTVTFSAPWRQVVYVSNPSTKQIFQLLVQADGTLGPLNPAVVATQTPLTFQISDPKGKSFYAMDATGGTIYRWTINPDGTLTSAAPALTSAPTQLKSLVFDPAGQFAYVVSQGSTPGTSNISAYSIAPDGSFNTLNSSISVSGRPVLKMQPSGHFVFAFAGGTSSDTIYGFSIGANGLLTPTSPASYVNSTGVGCTAFDPTGNFYYVATTTTDASQSAILQFSVSSAGSLQPLSPPSVSVPPPGYPRAPVCPVVDPKGRFVYASNGVEIFDYRINANGTLLALGTSSSGGNGGYAVLIDKTGSFMYVNHNFSNNITQFSVPPSGGAPTPLMPAIVPPTTPGGTAPTGSFVNTWIGAGPP